ncbi:MAG: AraC family transcriptional regulator [Ignavibacteriales bacterium]|nr:AraC family transcriptional regulator [Ignavibacteriales bacterium]
MVTIQTYIPKSLQGIIKSFWFLEVPSSHQTPYLEEIIPDGHHEIIFHLNGHTAERRLDHNEWMSEPNAFIASQTLKSYTLKMLPGSKLYGIRFYPHTLSALLRIPASHLTNTIPPLNDVFNEEPFWNCISDNPNDTFLNLEGLLFQKTSGLDFHSNGFSYLSHSVAKMLASKGNIGIDQLLKTTGISAKHLDNLFKEHVGLTPKTLTRILKFNHFISYKSNNPEKNLTECCYETGYYDQSHLIKSFHSFTNKSPKSYFGNNNFINETFSSL